MGKYHDVDRCVEKYLERQLRHYRELRVLYIIVYTTLMILFLSLLFVIPNIIWYVLDTFGVGTSVPVVLLSIMAYCIIIATIINFIQKWERKGALPTLLQEYKQSRFVWWDSMGKIIKGEDDDEKFFHALVQSSVKVCGSEVCCYSFPDGYIKESVAFLKVLLHKYNCDKSIRKQRLYLTVEEVEQLSKGR